MTAMPSSPPEPHLSTLGAVARCPRPLTSFVGRERELAAVRDLLASDNVRLVTLTGPGGVGKTRLALRAVESVAGYPDGVAFVALAAVRGPALVASTIAAALGVAASAVSSATPLVSHLRQSRGVLILDNFEQVIDAAMLVADLLAGCPHLRILVTSRVDLHVSGEHVFPVFPMYPPGAQTPHDATDLAANDAVRLFTERARARSASFALTPHNVAAVANVCRLVDGLPLAIELAAARVTVLDPAALATRLDHRMTLLTGGPRDLPERQRSIRATVAWSHDLLPPAVQRFFRRMSVFVGGFTIEAAERAGGLEGDADPDALTAISTLADSSLLQTVPGFEGEPRYVMLETIREFGLERLATSGEEPDARDAHAVWCLELVRSRPPDQASPQMPVYMRWVDRLHPELGNLRTALAWLSAASHWDRLAELAVGMHELWFLWNLEAEGLQWYQLILRLPPDHVATRRGDVLAFAGQFMLGRDLGAAETMLGEALCLAQQRGDIAREADVTRCLGHAAEERSDLEAAECHYLDARARYERQDDRWGTLLIDFHLGVISLGRGALREAADAFERVSTEAEALGDTLIPAWCATPRSLIACEQGCPERAARLLAPSFEQDPHSHRHSLSGRLTNVAVVAAVIGNDASAARLFGASETAAMGIAPPATLRRLIDPVAAAARLRLGAEAWDHAYETGRRLGEAEVLAEVHEILDRASQPSEPPEPAPPVLPISEREVEVLRLLTEGRSDAEIAAALFISRRTAATHVAHIYQKIGVTGRAAAAAWAVRHGLG